jgi:hypothetical protein
MDAVIFVCLLFMAFETSLSNFITALAKLAPLLLA